jgi:hypothetical protein
MDENDTTRVKNEVIDVEKMAMLFPLSVRTMPTTLKVMAA